MKRVFAVLLGAGLLFLPLFASAEEEDYLAEFAERLPEGVSLPAEGEDLTRAVGLEAFFSELSAAFAGEYPKLVSFALFALGVTFLSALSGIAPAGLGDFTSFGADAVCACLLFGKLAALLSGVTETLTEASEFFRGVIPVLAAVHAAGGGVSSASATALSGAFVFEILNTLTVKILPPLTGVLSALGLFGALSPQNGSAPVLGDTVRSAVTKIFGWLTLLFSFALGLQTAVGTAQDSVSLRAAKYAASSMIPIVGNTVSGALGSLLASLSYMKSVIGVFGTYALILTAAPLLIRLLSVRFILGFCSRLLSFFGGKSRVMGAFLAPVDVLTATAAFSTFLMILETVLSVRAGVGG